MLCSSPQGGGRWDREMNSCSTARSYLEERFRRRGVQRFLKITPAQDRNNKLLSTSAVLEPGPRQLLPGRRRPLGVPRSWPWRGERPPVVPPTGKGWGKAREGASIGCGMASRDADGQH